MCQELLSRRRATPRGTRTAVAALPLRLARLISFALLTLVVLSSRAAADEEPAPCLSPHVGEILSEKLATHAFDGALPKRWLLQELNVDRDHINLETIDPQGRKRTITLRPKGEALRVVDGRGRWFSFAIDAGGAPLGDEGRQGLLGLAARVDAAIPEDEALRVCAADTADSGGVPGPPGTRDVRSSANRGGQFPRWIALSIGALQVLLVLGGLIFAQRMRRGRRATDGTGERGSAWLDFGVFILAWLAIRAAGGSSPILWLDTINDQRDAHQCLMLGACTTLGEATSVDGIHHAVGWLDMLSLARFARLSLDTVYVVIQVLSAVAVMLASAVAREVGGGRPAGLLGGLVCLGFIGKCVNAQALYNTTPLPFLGAVFLLVGIAFVTRPGPASIAITALLAALLASVHAACVVSFVSVVWIAFLAPRDRVKLAAIGATVFVTATLAVGPAAWFTTIHHVWSLATGSGAHRGAIGGGTAAVAAYGILIALTVTAGRVTRPEQRPLANVAMAIVLPMLGASMAAAAMSTVPTNDKYLAHVAPSGAVLIAALAATLASRIPRGSARAAGHAIVGSSAVLVVSYIAVVLSGMTRFPVPMLMGRDRPITFHEASCVPRTLSGRGWTYGQVYRSLRSPHAAEILASFEAIAPEFPLGPGSDNPSLVYVAKLETSAVPQPLPPQWVVADQDGGWSILLAFVRPLLLWEHFEACDPGAPAGGVGCVESGLSLNDDEKPVCVYCVPGMPPFQRPGNHPFELRLTVQPRAGETLAIAMSPMRPTVCGGSIASVPGGPSAISADHQRATWVEPTGGSMPQEVRLDWTVGSRECDTNSYSGLPPFFLEGDLGMVEQLERLGF